MHGDEQDGRAGAYQACTGEQTYGSAHDPDSRAHMAPRPRGSMADTADSIRSAASRGQVWTIRYLYVGVPLARTLA